MFGNNLIHTHRHVVGMRRNCIYIYIYIERRFAARRNYKDVAKKEF